MSVNGDEPWSASEDLSTHRYKIMVNSISTVARADTQGEATIGVLQGKPKSGEDAAVTVIGPTKIVAGGTIVGGGDFTVTASATAMAVASGDYTLGRAFTSAASGNIFDGYVTHAGFKGQ